MSKKLSAIADQMLACRAKAEELTQKNRQLRDEIAHIALKNREIRERALFLVTSAQRMEWALDPDRRRPAKHFGGELKDSKGK